MPVPSLPPSPIGWERVRVREERRAKRDALLWRSVKQTILLLPGQCSLNADGIAVAGRPRKDRLQGPAFARS